MVCDRRSRQASGPRCCSGCYPAPRQAQAHLYPTGKKLEKKLYQHHTGWIGNLKEVKYATLMAEKPEFAMELAVKGMLPKNSIGRSSMTRLKVYAGAEHKNAAQKPEPWTAI